MPWRLTFLIWLYLVVSTAQQFLPWRRMWSRCCRITTPNAVGGVELQRGIVSLDKSGDTPIQIHGQFPWERWSLSIINQFVEKCPTTGDHGLVTMHITQFLSAITKVTHQSCQSNLRLWSFIPLEWWARMQISMALELPKTWGVTCMYYYVIDYNST